MRRENELRYTELANILREQIYSGYIKPGEYLLSENRLSEYYGMSRTSVRATLDKLMQEGLIVKQPSRGSMVSPDLIIPGEQHKTLQIVCTSPSEFMNACLPIVIETFEREHPHVKVKVIGYPAGSFWDCLNGGMEPDLLLITDRQYADIESDEAFGEFHVSVSKSASGIYPKLLSAFRGDGKFKAIPVTFSTIFMAYNPGLFEKYNVPKPTADWVREDLLRAAQKLTLDTNGDGITDQYGLSLSSTFSRWLVFALQNDVRFFTKSDQIESLQNSLDFIHDLLFRYKIATLFQSRRFLINGDAFPRQRAAMVLTTSMELAGWRKQMPFEPQVTAMPFGPSEATTAVANLFAIPSTCRNYELANLFVQTAIREDVQKTMVERTRFISVLKQVNPQVWSDDYLHSLNIHNGDIENSYFLHELFPNPIDILDLEQGMEWFWAGLEPAASFAGQLHDIIARRFSDNRA
ncbi:extracellular solute-binding protein [Paenibacillus hemerocallicola]|uniref:Extracellular solute-binding protein n=1 Tax=Paenibacillus hemerocallicola TaxID=1172614 RepID=A0A5C4T6U1_9BACL|nr:extracellular solute-binding protein [Paenibacillus hemerocallicola]TNJ63969.1 extracellular solute-binding protein [Paenibacillus hemerocallicola]